MPRCRRTCGAGSGRFPEHICLNVELGWFYDLPHRSKMHKGRRNTSELNPASIVLRYRLDGRRQDTSSGGLSGQGVEKPERKCSSAQMSLVMEKAHDTAHRGGSSKQGPNGAVLRGMRSAACACASRQLSRGEWHVFYITEILFVGAIHVLPAGHGCAAITRCESDPGMLTVS